jgi:hypothetical protein
MLECPRNDAVQLGFLQLPNHGVRFTATSLPIGEDRPVVTLDNVLHQLKGSLLVDETLC